MDQEKKECDLKISFSQFKEIIFDKQGKLAKYIIDYIKRVIISEDYEEMERSIEIYRYLFIIKNKNEKRMIEGECQEVFLFKRSSF